jgi:uncharacterized protein
MTAPEPGNAAGPEFDDDDDTGNRLPGGTARAVLDYIARQLVDDPDGISIEVEERRGDLTLRVHAAPGDLGRLIGRRGRVAQAMRAVTRAAGATDSVRVSVDIED